MSAYHERRAGRFVVRREYLDDNLGPYIFKDMIPVKVERDWCTDNLEVTAVHDCFEPVPKGCGPPFYDFELKFESVPRTDITGAVVGARSEFRGITWTKRD